MRGLLTVVHALAIAGILLASAGQASAQSFGVELHNTLMPVSGAMGGASIARPQDLQSALGGNPATLAQFHGTQFSFGGAWIEPTYNLSNTAGPLPNLGTFSGKSGSQGSALGNIGVIQDLRAMDMPVTFGVGFFAGAGAGVDWRAIPESNGTTVVMQVLQIAAGVGVDVTDRLSAGANLMLGSATVDGPFIGLTAASYDYALRGAIGFDYDIDCATTVGLYYQTRQNFNFDNAIRLQLPVGFDVYQDLDADMPDNIGFGLATERFMDGNLLLAVDVLYKQWDNTALFGSVYDNQWVLQLGAQYKWNRRVRLRAGYVYAENPISPNPGNSGGNITPPGGVAALYYAQAQFAVVNPHRATMGIGIRDVLPGIDFDLFGGGMFRASQQFGPLTSTNLESYWLGAAMTWKFGRGACERLPIPNEW